MTSLNAPVSLVARALLAAIFIWSGYGKITGYDGAVAYMQGFGVPGVLLPLVILAELGGGLAILLGVLSRPAALALALFTLAAAIIFHSNFGDEVQQIMFMKNLAMAGGLLLLFVNGPGAYAVRD
jgi:putative oxidoreductase